MFQPVFPAAVGEFVSILNSEEYWKDLLVSTRFPGIVEIVMAQLTGHVK